MYNFVAIPQVISSFIIQASLYKQSQQNDDSDQKQQGLACVTHLAKQQMYIF